MKDFKPKIYQNDQKKITVFLGLCKGCGLCIERCPVKAISYSQKDTGHLSTPAVEIDIEKCINCGLCVLFCPDSALNNAG